MSLFIKKNNSSFLNLVYKLKNLEHRLELVAKIKNISIFNDSKSTNINSAKNAIKSLDNIYWILGGRKKRRNRWYSKLFKKNY